MSRARGSLRVRVYTSVAGNLFMTEIARLIQAGLSEIGVDTVFAGGALPGSEPGWCNLVVAPHELFELHPTASREEALDAAARSVMVATEQPGTPWFESAIDYAAAARGVLDIDPAGAAAFARIGVEAHHLPLGYHESWDAWRGDRARPRRRDVVFMGSLSARRHRLLAALSPRLESRTASILVHDGTRPVTRDAPNFLTGTRKHELLASTRVLLNVHRDERPYFEWHRLLGALANGCVILTEPSDSYTPLVPFEHFLVAEPDLLGEHLTMILGAEDLRASMAASAYDFVRSHHRMAQLLEPLLPVLREGVVGRGIHRPRGMRRSRPGYDAPGVARSPRAGTTAPASDVPTSTPEQRALQRALLAQAALRRQVDALSCRLAHGADQHVEIVQTATFASARPDVSVIVPLHNYAQHVGEALGSVVDSLDVAPEIVVVDDHSTDDSRRVVEDLMACHDDLPIRLVALAANIGLSAVRNLALEHIRTDAVFLLDADNTLYPRGLARLRAALDSSDAAFAYGIVEGFGEEQRMVGVYPWDVGRLVQGNYIDAMVMIRPAVWRDVGGFSEEMQDRHGGWEDYDLWLRLADRGHHAVHVPQVVARYRIQRSSMVGVVNLDVSGAFELLRERYPGLPWEVPPGVTEA